MAFFGIGNFDILGTGGGVGGVNYKGSVSSKSALDAMTDMANGDVWLVVDEGKKYIWSEADLAWQIYSDAGLSEAEVLSIVNARINPLLAKKVDKEDGMSLMSDAEHEKLEKAITEHQSLEGYVQKVEGKGLSTIDLTEELKAKYDEAYTHSQRPHAPIDAEKNIIEIVKQNGVPLVVDPVDRSVDVIGSSTPVSKPSVTIDECPSSINIGDTATMKVTVTKGTNDLKDLKVYVDNVVVGTKTSIMSGSQYPFTYTAKESDGGKSLTVKAEVFDTEGQTSAALATMSVMSANGYHWEVGYLDYEDDSLPYVKLKEGNADVIDVQYTFPNDLDPYGVAVFKYDKAAPDITHAVDNAGFNEFSSFIKTIEGNYKVYTFNEEQSIGGAGYHFYTEV